MRLSPPLILTLLMSLAITGCANTGSFRIAPDDRERPARVADLPALDDVLQALPSLDLVAFDGTEVKKSLAESLDAAGWPRVVFAGEAHTYFEHHLVQLALLQHLHRRDAKLAIGVEWFEQEVQDALDDYVAKRIDEREMLRRTRYYERWHYDYRFYKPILDYARRFGIRIIALNAPQVLTRKIGREGIDALAPSERLLLPDDLGAIDDAYRRRMQEVYEQHSDDQQPFERFISVMQVWDETMAANAARFLRENPEYRLLVLAGNGHAGYRNAIPERLARRIPVSMISFTTTNERPHTWPLPNYADVAVVAPALKLPAAGRLGVLVTGSSEQGATVSGVLPGSGAARSGIRKGDRITKLGQLDVNNFRDLKLALFDKSPGEVVDVTITQKDQGERMLQVTLQ